MEAKEVFQVLHKTLELRIEFSKTLGHLYGFLESHYLQYSKHCEGSQGNKEIYAVNNKQK